MIERYSREEIASVWTQRRKMEGWLEVELAVTDALAGAGTVPAADAAACRERASFTVEAVEERERTTNHDVAAFVDVVAASIGPEGRWIHYGLTSSDVLDTALATQIRAAGEIVVAGARAYRDALVERAVEHRDTVCVGRTHGIHAEPTSFGLRLAGFAFEADRNAERLERAFAGALRGKLSGAVGTYASLPPSVEAAVMERLGLEIEDASTQIVPRDRHAELLSAIALAGAGLERFATEVRNLQHTEIGEVQEPFRSGQKGSSAMPHKRNPITAERLSGLARLLRGYAVAGMEDQALWHERDISHSSVERVALPGATTLLHYMLARFRGLVEGLVVRADRMTENIERGLGLHASSRLLTALVEDGGLSREAAYAIVQRAALRSADERRPFRELVVAEPEVTSTLAHQQLEDIFDDARSLRHVPTILARLDAIAPVREPSDVR